MPASQSPSCSTPRPPPQRSVRTWSDRIFRRPTPPSTATTGTHGARPRLTRAFSFPSSLSVDHQSSTHLCEHFCWRLSTGVIYDPLVQTCIFDLAVDAGAGDRRLLSSSSAGECTAEPSAELKTVKQDIRELKELLKEILTNQG